MGEASGSDDPPTDGQSEADGPDEPPGDGGADEPPENGGADESPADGPSEAEVEAAKPVTAKVRQALTRRRVLAGVVVLLVLAVVVVLLVPPSLLTLAFSSSAEFGAQPATASEATLAERGYDSAESGERVVRENVSIAGLDRTIVTTNHLHRYERTLDVQNETVDGAVFALVSTPAIEVAGSSLNPLAGASHEQILDEFSDELPEELGGLDDIERVNRREGVLRGKRTTISQFVTTVEEDEPLDVYLYVARIRSGSDVLIAVGGHPAAFTQERLSILELMATAEHPGQG